MASEEEEKQFEDQISSVILLAERVQSTVDDAVFFKSECSDVGKQVDRLLRMLNTVAGLSRTTPFSYERPIRRIIGEVFKNLERALTLVGKCKSQSVIRRVLTFTRATDFRKLSNFLESSIGDMKWLLSIFDPDSGSNGIVLAVPPIASNDSILARIWSYIAAIQMGQLAVRIQAAIELGYAADGNDRNKKLIVEEGGVFPLLKLLREESSAEAQIAAMTVLSYLASDQEKVRAIVNEGGVPIIEQVLRDSPEEVQTKAASLAARIAEHSSVADSWKIVSHQLVEHAGTLTSLGPRIVRRSSVVESGHNPVAEEEFLEDTKLAEHSSAAEDELETGEQSSVAEDELETGEQSSVAEDEREQSSVAEDELETGEQSSVAEDELETGEHSSVAEDELETGEHSSVAEDELETGEQPLEDSAQPLEDTNFDTGKQPLEEFAESGDNRVVEEEFLEDTKLHADEPAPPQWKHDVFLSFRGEDTRAGFLSHLYHELQNTKVIRTFMDDEQLDKGKNISQSLLTAIEESRFAIIVLSENYAFSSWCLDELTKIVQCMESKNTILPIFFRVDPSDVRYQKNNFEAAFTKHSSNRRYDDMKVKQWKANLTKVANLSGWDLKRFKSERELIEDIVKFVLEKVRQAPREDSEDFEEFEATREAMDEVRKMLKDDKIAAIGVYGRGGVGKTVLVKHASAEAERIGLFDHVVVAVISRNPDLQKIQGALLNQLGLELVEEEEIERASRLKEAIMREKRLLIILDDIWEKIELSSIGIPSYEDLQRCNSKVLITTRIMELCHSMGCQSHIPLNSLSEEDSLRLFMEKSRKPFHGSTDEERNTVKECAGLPSVLEEAARAFGHKYVKEWNEAVSKAFGDDDIELPKTAQELNASQLVPTKDERDRFKRIELSYHTLMFDDAKSFLVLCCMFPEDYDISIEELLKYGIGKGLLKHSDTLQEARDRAHSLVAYLKASALLLDGEKGCLRMHSDIRKVVMSIALSEGHAFFVKAGCELKDWPMEAHEGYSAISLMRNDLNKLPETLVCPDLQILLLQSNAGICHIPSTFFQSPNALRVFDLSYTSISVLPSSSDLLTNLHTLCLDCCKNITDISVLGKLKKVEILSLRKFAHKELPMEIGNLTSLRMLDVTGGCVHTIPSKLISRLYRLEELYMKCEFGDWGSKVEEAVGKANAHFDEIIGLFRLNILKVYISDAACLPKDIGYFEPNWVKFDICISNDLSLEMMLSPNDQPSRTLTLDRSINGLSDWFINVVTQNAEKLEYRDCKGLDNILKEYEHGRLYGLKHLSIIGCHENLEELINATTWNPSKPVFESLEELHLLHLQCLKELCVGELPLGSLCNLKLLKVQTCSNLVNALLPPKLLQRLTNLDTIFCVNMKHMKYVFGSEGLEPATILLTKLSKMRLCALSELISIWNGPAPSAVFRNLKVLAVCMCTELRSLLPFNVARYLVHLEDLSVESCPNLGRVIEASNSLDRCFVFIGLKKLALINLPELTWFYIENDSIDIQCPLLEYLYVDECPQFTHSASASASVKLNDEQHLNSLVKRWEDMYNL